MSNFRVHFFKEKTREIDILTVINFFKNELNFDVYMDEKIAKFSFKHNHLKYPFEICITPKSTVPDLYRLSPIYLDVNMHANISLFTPSYIIKEFFKIIEILTKKFDLQIYHEIFEDVQKFKNDLLVNSFKIIKNAYIKKNPQESEKFHFFETKKLFYILKYLNDLDDLREYYNKEDISISDYIFYPSNEKFFVGFLVEKLDTAFIIPPQINLLGIKLKNNIVYFSFEEIDRKIKSIMEKVPGTVEGTMKIPKKYSAKFLNLLRKNHKILDVDSNLKVGINKITDY